MAKHKIVQHVELTDEEKARGRIFRDAQVQALSDRLELERPTYTPPAFVSIYRHECAGRNNVSTALGLKEVYITSECGTFGYIYKEGECRSCGETALSPIGKFVLSADRPPLENRKARK